MSLVLHARSEININDFLEFFIDIHIQYRVFLEPEGGGISSTTVTFEACFFTSSFDANKAETKGSAESPSETLATLLKGSLSLTERHLGAATLSRLAA